MDAATQNLRDEYLSFRLDAEEYAIDILRVREIRAHEKPTRIANAPRHIEGVINLRGAIVPIVDLRARFGMPAAAATIAPVSIILAVADRSMGIVVDAVSDVVTLARDTIRPAPPELQSAVEHGFVRGLAPCDDRLLIVVALDSLLDRSAEAVEAA